jgi:hypothetical protein
MNNLRQEKSIHDHEPHSKGFAAIAGKGIARGGTPSANCPFRPARLPVCLPACLFACLSVCLPVCLSACLPVCLSVCLSVCLPVCLSVCLPARLLKCQDNVG